MDTNTHTHKQICDHDIANAVDSLRGTLWKFAVLIECNSNCACSLTLVVTQLSIYPAL